MSRQLLRALGTCVLALGVVLGAVAGLPATAAHADDSTASWSVTPADANGQPDGQIRYEIELAAGESVERHVLVTNSSTVEREFAVYGADGFTTPSGGYDVAPAATPSTDLGAWVTAASPSVTIAPLATATVAFTVAVPAGATPGDHPGGIVVSPVRAQVTADGVVVDTRVAVRLNVRVEGQVSAALEVRGVSGTYAFTAVPFASAPATVTYEIVNTGNVKVVGIPRVRVTGPFGISVAEIEVDATREVVPGDSFTLTTVLDGVAPVGLATVVVDVEMAAAPGPATEIPLVSSTARSALLVVPWTGLALALLLVLAIAALVQRLRRREGAEAVAGAVSQAPARPVPPVAPVDGPRAGASGTLVALLAALALAGSTLVVGAPTARADEPDDGALSLTVPRAPSSSAAPALTPPRRPPARANPASGTTVPAVPEAEAGSPDLGAAEAVNATADGGLPDLLWALKGPWTPLQWTLLGLGGAGALGGLGYAGRGLLHGRRGTGAAS